MEKGNASARATGQSSAVYLIGLVVVLGFVLATVKGFVDLGEGGSGGSTKAASPASASRFDASRFILNALLVPALDSDAVPLRWVDPRPVLRCGPASNVRVNGAPLIPGALVPDAPFELDWHADACRPFGPAGPRLDGSVQLTVFREDWGFTALVAPQGLVITPPWHPSIVVRRGAVSMPQSAPEYDPFLTEAE